MKSLPDSLQAVRDLACQFPGPPSIDPMPPVAEALSPIPQAFESPSEYQFEGSSSHEGFAAISDEGGEWNNNGNVSPPIIALSDNKSARSTRQPTLYNVNVTSLRTASFYRVSEQKHFDPFNDNEEDSSRTAIVDHRPISSSPDAEAETGNSSTSRQSPRRRPRSVRPMSKKDIPFSRVRSFGEDPRNTTSSLPKHRRGNMQLKDIIIPPRRLNMPEIMDENSEGLTSIGGRF